MPESAFNTNAEINLVFENTVTGLTGKAIATMIGEM